MIHLRNETLVLEVTFGADARRHWDSRTGAECINRRARLVSATVTTATTRRTAALARVLAVAAGVLARVLAVATGVLARVFVVYFTIAAGVLAVAASRSLLWAAPGTTRRWFRKLVIRIIEGDRGVNTAGPGCIRIAAR